MLSTCPAVGRSAGLRRQKAACSPGVQALLPLSSPSSPGAHPSPRRPGAAQTYLRVGGRGLRRAVRAPPRRVRPSRLGRAALALRSRGRARTALSLTQPGSTPAAAGAAERLQTCSVSGPARVEATKSHPRRGRRRRAAELRPRAGGDHAGGPGKRGRRAAKNSSCGRKPRAANAPPRRASPQRALGLWELESCRTPALGNRDPRTDTCQGSQGRVPAPSCRVWQQPPCTLPGAAQEP